MKNLFICHTQAHLILASGLALGRFKDDDNLLILFVDFGIKDELKERLNKTFTRTLYLQSIYPAEMNTAKAKLKWYPQDWKQIKQFLTEPVDRAFAVCDWLLLVQKTLQLAHKLNPNTEMAWLEDGIIAYFVDTNNTGGLDSNPFTRTIRKFLVKYILGVRDFYNRDFRGVGGLKYLKKCYACYPDIVREPYFSQRQVIAIEDYEYHLGLQAMYTRANLNISSSSVILVVDKLDRYTFPEKVKTSLKHHIDKWNKEGKEVICKFHPRETILWDVFDGCKQIEKTVGIESAYLSLSDKKDNIVVVGIKSAGIMSAKKLGFSTYTLFSECGESNDELETFFERIGIESLNHKTD